MFNRVQAFWSQSHKRDGFALGLAVGTFGITFGVLANAAGISDLMAVVLSLLVFTGASQFAAVGVVNAGGEPLTALGTALLLGARNGVYGLSVGRILPVGKFKRLLGAQLVIDESVAVSSLQLDDRDAREAFWVTGLSHWLSQSCERAAQGRHSRPRSNLLRRNRLRRVLAGVELQAPRRRETRSRF